MNGLTEHLMAEFKPTLALMIYTGNNSQAYIESHQVNERGQILAGKPLAKETLESIVDVFFDERQNRVKLEGMLPQNLLHFEVLPGGQFRMIWFRPAEQRILHFEESLKVPSGPAMVPPLIYDVCQRQLSVYASISDERPDEATPLYRGPFHNVSANGDVCLGSAKLKKPKENTYHEIMKYWEDLFWLSSFSHITGSESPVKDNLNLLWTQGVQHPEKVFPIKQLLPMLKSSADYPFKKKKGAQPTTLKDIL